MLCKQAGYKSNREVFAKEYVISVEAEQNQPLCTYVYISLDMCKELLHFYSCGSRSLWQKVSSIHEEENCRADFSKWQRVIFIKCRRAHWQSKWALYGFSGFKDPQISSVCQLFLICEFYFLTLFWLADVSPGTSGPGVGSQWSSPVCSSGPSCRQLLAAFLEQVLKTVQLLILQRKKQRHKEQNGIIVVTNMYL